MAAWRIRSLRLAVRRMSGGNRLETSPSHILSVSLSLNDTITRRYYYKRIVLSSTIMPGTGGRGRSGASTELRGNPAQVRVEMIRKFYEVDPLVCPRRGRPHAHRGRPALPRPGRRGKAGTNSKADEAAFPYDDEVIFRFITEIGKSSRDSQEYIGRLAGDVLPW